jgi:CheY-like chemotaxis protein
MAARSSSLPVSKWRPANPSAPHGATCWKTVACWSFILAEMTRLWGMLPTCAESAKEALAVLRAAAAGEAPFHLLISDVNMPEVDGCTLLQWVRNDPLLADTPVIMLTSGARPGDIQKCERLGVLARLMKPVIQSELLDAVGMAVGGPATAAGTRPAELSAPEQELRPLRILLAEDSLVNRKLAVGLLEKHGHTVAAVENGNQAVEAFRRQGVDVILMDVEMPELDGLAATQAIREIERTSGTHVPIIAMTAHALKGDRERCLAAGMDDYISKPIQATHLFEILRKVLGG